MSDNVPDHDMPVDEQLTARQQTLVAQDPVMAHVEAVSDHANELINALDSRGDLDAAADAAEILSRSEALRVRLQAEVPADD